MAAGMSGRAAMRLVHRGSERASVRRTVRGATPGVDMRGYRAPRAFDGEHVLPDGALVLVECDTIVGVESGAAPAPADCPVTDLPGTTLLPGLMRFSHLVPRSSDAKVSAAAAIAPMRCGQRVTRSRARQRPSRALPRSAGARSALISRL